MAIFLSYSQKNGDLVKSLAQGFEEARRDVWFDHNLGGGDAWWDTILEQIRSASVFVFGLSDESLKSKPCRQELDYAMALDRPIVPVQVGRLTDQYTHPLVRYQIVSYRPDDAHTAFGVLAAVDEAAKRVRPLPDPLPPPPPIPQGYLLVLGRQIESTELSLADQFSVVDQLGRALLDENDDDVRHSILAMLVNLNSKPWRALGIESQINALLRAYAPSRQADGDGTADPGPQPEAVEEPGTGEVSADPPPAASPPLFSPPPKADGDGTADPGPQPEAVEEPGTGEVSADPPPAASPPLFSPPPKPDSAEWFAERMRRLQEKVDEEERTWEPPVWVPPPIVGQMWPWGAGGADEGSPTDSAQFDWDAQPTVPSEPLLVGHAETERPGDVESAQASRKARVWGVGGIAVAVVLVVILVLIF